MHWVPRTLLAAQLIPSSASHAAVAHSRRYIPALDLRIASRASRQSSLSRHCPGQCNKEGFATFARESGVQSSFDMVKSKKKAKRGKGKAVGQTGAQGGLASESGSGPTSQPGFASSDYQHGSQPYQLAAAGGYGGYGGHSGYGGYGGYGTYGGYGGYPAYPAAGQQYGYEYAHGGAAQAGGHGHGHGYGHGSGSGHAHAAYRVGGYGGGQAGYGYAAGPAYPPAGPSPAQSYGYGYAQERSHDAYGTPAPVWHQGRDDYGTEAYGQEQRWPDNGSRGLEHQGHKRQRDDAYRDESRHHHSYRPQPGQREHSPRIDSPGRSGHSRSASTYPDFASSSMAGHPPGTSSAYMRSYSTFAQESHNSSYHSPSTGAAARNRPRISYIQQAQREPKELPGDRADPPKQLLILDLNGTLVYRSKNKGSMSISSTTPTPRPYLDCFVEYCLGISRLEGNQNGNGDDVRSGSLSPGRSESSEAAVESMLSPTRSSAARRPHPHGAHFWPPGSSAATTSLGRCELLVWSSAQPANVDSMVRAAFSETQRQHLLRVWARDTLVNSKLFRHKVESIKDLEIVWTELNAWANGLPSPGRLLADSRERQNQLNPDLPERSVAEINKAAEAGPDGQDKEGAMSAALKAALRAAKLGPWGQHNTLLLDDSVDKARMQPFNQILLPEFDKKAAELMERWMRQEALRLQPAMAAAREKRAESDAEEDDSDDDGFGSDLSVEDKGYNPHKKGAPASSDPLEEADEEESVRGGGEVKVKDLDDVLLQTIGALEELRWQKDVSSFIKAGGLAGYGGVKAKKTKKQELRQHRKGYPEYWATRGREACEDLGIEVTPRRIVPPSVSTSDRGANQ